MNVEANKAVVRKYYELLDKGDVEGIIGIFSDDILWRFPGMPEPLNKETLKGLIQGFKSAFPDMKHTFRNELADGDQVATALTFTGTQTGEMQGIAPSNNKVEFTALNIHRVKDGKIAEAETGFDMMTLMQQIGALPESG